MGVTECLWLASRLWVIEHDDFESTQSRNELNGKSYWKFVVDTGNCEAREASKYKVRQISLWKV